MWRQWEKWGELENNAQNYWIHTHIMRRPGVCSGKFQYQRKTQDDRIHYYGCENCGYLMAVSTVVMRYEVNPFPSRHRRGIPDYCSEPKACQKLLALIAERGETDSLIAPVLAALETPTETLDKAIFLSHLSLYPKKVASAFVKGYGALLAANRKDYTERQEWILSRCLGCLDETGVPLFAKIGSWPQESYHEWDLPYLMYPPSEYAYPTAEVLIARMDDTDRFVKYIPPEVQAFYDQLTKQFRKVSPLVEHRHLDRRGSTYYWSAHVDLF